MTNVNNIKNIAKTTANKAIGKDIHMDLNTSLKEAVKTLKDEISKMPDVGYFSDIAIDFMNPSKEIYAKAISLTVQRDVNAEGKGYLVLNMLHPTMMINGSKSLGYGDRAKLIEIVSDSKFVESLNSKIKDVSEFLRNTRGVE